MRERDARKNFSQWFIYRCEMWKLMYLNTTCYYNRCFMQLIHKLNLFILCVRAFHPPRSPYNFSHDVAVDIAQIMCRTSAYLICHNELVSIDSHAVSHTLHCIFLFVLVTHSNFYLLRFSGFYFFTFFWFWIFSTYFNIYHWILFLTNS